ncbi:PREDICTED: flexible cuticle protein 12-like [Nicrophorus vespilloides]|uniref:Flexible cuticle protein 12-like n=1 Tax=Nicrophorus vespilloides TaxID=110193 RepID=A0ABM1ML39_NICVS|nr:PREDICTED: flexible cuticle protein 12-like [Nicrophorus vespilloides]
MYIRQVPKCEINIKSCKFDKRTSNMMKLILVSVLIAFVAAEPPVPVYGPPEVKLQKNSEIRILDYKNENNGDGSYRFNFETENKITQQESGELKNVGTEDEVISVEGSYSYEGPDGVTYTVHYIADENGFRAFGDHIPTPPPTQGQENKDGYKYEARNLKSEDTVEIPNAELVEPSQQDVKQSEFQPARTPGRKYLSPDVKQQQGY